MSLDSRPRPKDRAALLLNLDPFPTVESCVSTQELCRNLAAEGAPEGTVVSALEQTAGRGRENRLWHSPRGLGLWLSFVLRPRISSAEWPSLTALTALALAEAIESFPRADRSVVAIKWPNDLQGKQGKLAGILAEAVGDAVIVGIGLNLGQSQNDFPPEIRGRASSLRIEGFQPIPGPRDAACRLNERLTWHYRRFQNGVRGFLRDGLHDRFFLRGAWVGIAGAGGRIEGRAVDLGSSGELVLEVEEGGMTRRQIVSGEVVLIRFPGSDTAARDESVALDESAGSNHALP